MRWPPFGEPPRNLDDWLRYLGHTDATLVEPKAIDPQRVRPLLMDLTVDEKFILAINVVELERRRGYR